MAKTLRVLAVDDVAETRQLLARLPMFGDVAVDLAGDGAEALSKYHAARPAMPYDVLVLDLAMPDMTGFQVAEEIRQDDADTKILLFTAHSDTMTIARASMVRADGIVTKPLNMQDLYTRIMQLFE